MHITDLLSPAVIAAWLASMVFGVFVGATPGLTATMAVALIVPMSFYMPEPAMGLAMIIGVSFTAIFAGDIPATCLRIPGTPASAAATLDAYELARQGRARRTLLLNLICSAAGGTLAIVVLAFTAPHLARYALGFSNFEYFWLAILGLCMSALVSSGATGRGLMAAALGILISAVGIDGVSGATRYQLPGSNTLLDMRDALIPVMIGLFGLSQVIAFLAGGRCVDRAALPRQETDGAWGGALGDAWKHKWTVLWSSMTGLFIGALPGAGADVAAWGSYGIAQRTSREGPAFGSGALQGVVAPTSANNAAVAGAWVPALVFGIPGDAVTAIVLGALLMYDIRPGPEIFTTQAAAMHTLLGIALITQALLLVAGWLGVLAFGAILRLPKTMIMAGVTLFSVVGSYALHHSLIDVWIMVGFGILGFFLDTRGVPLAPLILGLILGPLAESKLRAGLISESGDWMAMFTRPICVVIVVLLVATLVLPRLLRGSGRVSDAAEG